MLTSESAGVSSAEAEASRAATTERYASYAQAIKHDGGAGPQAAAQLLTGTPQGLPSTPTPSMGGTTPAMKAPSSAPASSAAQLSAPPSRHLAPSTPPQPIVYTNRSGQPASQVTPPSSGPAGTQGPPGSEYVSQLRTLPTASSPAARQAAQHASPHPLPPTTQIRDMPSSALIRAVRPGASASRVQPLGLADALTAPRVAPTARPSAAPTASDRSSGGLLMQPGSWAGPEPGSPAAHMDLIRPCMIDPAESKQCVQTGNHCNQTDRVFTELRSYCLGSVQCMQRPQVRYRKVNWYT